MGRKKILFTVLSCFLVVLWLQFTNLFFFFIIKAYKAINHRARGRRHHHHPAFFKFIERDVL